MRSLKERNFHLLMAGLLLTSCFLDPAVRSVVPDWNPPRVGMVTLALALVWLGRWLAWRGDRLDDQIRVLKDRAERLERKTAALEDELRARPGYSEGR
jgi:hypothetical protein